MNRSKQMSESIRVGITLALAGGFMDAYSYICRGQVFANAQTGNILLFGIRLSEQDWASAIRYLFPVIAFTFGIIISDVSRIRKKEQSSLHWRQLSVFCEAIVLTVVCFIPQQWNLLANSLTSLACGIQVESFRKVHGNGIATTMCIGNLRSATQNLCEFWYTRDRESAKKGILYYGMILCFVAGAVLGNFCVMLFAEKAVLVCVAILAIAFFIMFVKPE